MDHSFSDDRHPAYRFSSDDRQLKVKSMNKKQKAKDKKVKDIDENLKSEWVRSEPIYVSKNDNDPLKRDRYKKFKEQLNKHGFCDSETWSLDYVISKFIVPRLKRFKEINNGFSMSVTSEEWNKILDKMIFAFEWNCRDQEEEMDYNPKTWKKDLRKHEEGMKLFAKYFRDLWW